MIGIVILKLLLFGPHLQCCRVISSYIDKVLNDEENSFLKFSCCGDRKEIERPASEFHLRKCSNLSGPAPFDLFVRLVRHCDQPYWRPQSRLMEPKYYKYINFVGHYEAVAADAMRLLKTIGGWEEFGSDGWGKDGKEPIFSANSVFLESAEMDREYKKYFHDRKDLEKIVEEVYRTDFQLESLGLN